MARRYGMDQAPLDPKVKLPAASAPTPNPAVAQRPAERTIAAARKVLAKVERETKISGETKSPETKSRRGRPRKRDVQPWVAEGVSKATWHRRQAKALKK